MLANKTDAQASLERIQNFEEAFARIKSATGIEDIEELVSDAGGAKVTLHPQEAKRYHAQQSLVCPWRRAGAILCLLSGV